MVAIHGDSHSDNWIKLKDNTMILTDWEDITIDFAGRDFQRVF